jgi:hypothetical protein
MFFFKVAKFSPKNIHVGVGDHLNRQLSSKELINEVATFASTDNFDKDPLNTTNSESALL